jgi:hypothetical protein
MKKDPVNASDMQSEHGKAEQDISEDEALTQLQSIIRSAGFSPAWPNAPKADAIKFDRLPKIVRDAVSMIMKISGEEEQERPTSSHALAACGVPESISSGVEDHAQDVLDLEPTQLDRRFREEIISPQFGLDTLSPSMLAHPTDLPLESECKPVASDSSSPVSSFEMRSSADQIIHDRHFSFARSELQQEIQGQTQKIAKSKQSIGGHLLPACPTQSDPKLDVLPDPEITESVLKGGDMLQSSAESYPEFDFALHPEDAGSSLLGDIHSPCPLPSRTSEQQKLEAHPPKAITRAREFQSSSRNRFAPLPEFEVGACDNFLVDLSSAQFGMCVCGFPKSSHRKVAPPPQDEKERLSPKLWSTIKVERGAKAPADIASKPNATPEVAGSHSTHPAGACTRFQLDTTAAQFGVCRCGFTKQAHVVILKAPSRSIEQPSTAPTNVGSQPLPLELNASSSSNARTFTLEQLQEMKRSGNYQGLDATRLETYLEEAEFSSTFGMSITDFTISIPSWKREQAKKKAGIF